MDIKKLLDSFHKIIDRAYNYDEALKRQDLKQEDIKRLREKISESKYVPRLIVDKQLLLFLNAFKNDIDKSAKVLENYYKLKKETPEIFANRDLESEAIQSSLDHQVYIALPVTPDNCNLIFHGLSSFVPEDYVFDDAVKTLIITSEACAFRCGPRDGTIFVDDMRGVSFRHLFRPSFSSIRKSIRFVEEGNPFNIKAIHVLNSFPLVDKIVALVKPFVRSEILNKVHFHSTNMDYEKFYKECIPKSHLPSDFGGDLESVEVLHNKHRESLMDLREYFLMEERQLNRHFDGFNNKYYEDLMNRKTFL